MRIGAGRRRRFHAALRRRAISANSTPNMIWELLIGGIVVVSFLAAVAIWILTALRRGQGRPIAA